MATVVTILSAVSGIYGFFWILFIFVNPPGSISHFFRTPSMLYFLPEKVGRFLIGAVLLGVIPLFAQLIVTTLFNS
ncbi:MAG TPA: hypothetical protein VL400_07550 [Polyangiaceae bacterium]|jgi:hypothetical protein|nr:hypothetical protein [Polyangiaceae bacterium]